MSHYHVGDHVVYRKYKSSTRPGHRAKHIHPAQHGDNYYYDVDKYWTVTGVTDNQTIFVMTRRGKVHELSADDPSLRRANILDEVFYRNRFPKCDAVDDNAVTSD